MSDFIMYGTAQKNLDSSEIVAFARKVPVDSWRSRYTGVRADTAYSAEFVLKNKIIEVQIYRTKFALVQI